MPWNLVWIQLIPLNNLIPSSLDEINNFNQIFIIVSFTFKGQWIK